MNTFINLWSKCVVKYRLAIILSTLCLIGIASTQLGKLFFDNSNERWFVQGDSHLVDFNESIELFGDSQYLVLGIDAPDKYENVFNLETIKIIDELSVFLESHDVVTQVRSLSNYQYSYSDDGFLKTEYLFNDISRLSNESSFTEYSAIMRNQILPINTLLTEDFKHTRIGARVKYKIGESAHHIALMNDVYDFILSNEYIKKGYLIHMAGRPVITERFKYHARKDASIVNPLLVGVMLAILLVSFRSIMGSLLPWFGIGTCLVLLVGVQAYIGIPMTVVTNAMPPTLIIIGMGLSVHVLFTFYKFRSVGESSIDAAQSTIRLIWLPAFYTSITTAVGFLALSVTKLVPVKEFAILGASGSVLMFFVTLTLLPCALSYTKNVSNATKKLIGTSLLTTVTSKLPKFTNDFRYILAFVGAMAIIFSVATLPKIVVDTNFVNFFNDNNWLKKDTEYFDDLYNGSRNLEIIVDSNEKGGINNPVFLKRVESLQDYLKSLDSTGDSNTLVDHVKRVSKVLHDDDKSYFSIPETQEEVTQYLLLYELSGAEENIEDLKDFDERFVRISYPFLNMDASSMGGVIRDVRAQLVEMFPDLSIRITGPMMMNNVQNEYVSKGVPRSFMAAMVIIYLCFIYLFKSFKYGTLALIPSVLPILVTGGIVSILGIPLDIGTMIVGAITLGIAVDDTIHVMTHYIQKRRDGVGVFEAVSYAMKVSGGAVIFTSVILIVGFSVMLFATFKPFVYTGLFSATIMSLALIGDLLILPALLYLFDKNKDKAVMD